MACRSLFPLPSTRCMTYDEAIAFWYGRMNFEVRSATPTDLKLERMRALLSNLGDPQNRLRIVHITGTKGKGSVAAMLAATLRAAGYRVGLFTSPHLVRVEERIQVNGVPIGEAELAARMTELAPLVDPASTFFEIATAIGFQHFLYRNVDIAIVEVGLGGRFDSTNVCSPLAAVITSIGLDHTAQLGETLEEIAFQKAGIIKPNIPTVSGVTQPAPLAVIRNIAAENASRIVQRGLSRPGGLDARSHVQQIPHEAGVRRTRGFLKKRFTRSVNPIDVGTSVNQEPGDLRVGRVVDCLLPKVILGGHLSSIFDEHFDARCLPKLRCGH